MEIKNKVIILTGAARIGIDVGRTLREKGAKLVVTYLNNKPDLGDVLYIKADLSIASDAERVVAETKIHYGQVDGLVHMAAIYPRTPWATVTEKDWDNNMDVIAKSAFLISKAVTKEMKEGKIIFFSDWSVLDQPYIDYLPYNVAKSAVVGLTKSLAKELAPNIAVNAIAPGPILKPSDLSSEDDEEVMKNTPLKRWGGEREISKAVTYLLETDFVTGQVLYVDGGRSIS